MLSSIVPDLTYFDGVPDTGRFLILTSEAWIAARDAAQKELPPSMIEKLKSLFHAEYDVAVLGLRRYLMQQLADSAERKLWHRKFLAISEQTRTLFFESLDRGIADWSRFAELMREEHEIREAFHFDQGVWEYLQVDPVTGMLVPEGHEWATPKKAKQSPNGQGQAGEDAGGAPHRGAKPEPESVCNRVFISYSHKDEKWLGELLDHLKPYTLQESVTVWSDENISPGQEWFAEIKAALASTRVAVLLVTKDFLASDFIDKHELAPLLAQAEMGNVHIIWIPVGACSYQETKLKTRQAIVDPAKPLAKMRTEDRNEVWVKICKVIKEAVTR